MYLYVLLKYKLGEINPKREGGKQIKAEIQVTRHITCTVKAKRINTFVCLRTN